MQTLISEPLQLPIPELSNPEDLLNALLKLRETVQDEGRELFEQWRPGIQRRSFLISGLNFAYYLALRRQDLRDLQMALTPWGLTSLGRSEARVLPNLDAAIATLGAVCNHDPATLPKRPPLRAFFRGDRILNYRARAVFGSPSPSRRVRIMVTLPTEAAENYELVRNLLTQGANCLRINCAHDTPVEWEKMVNFIRRAEIDTGYPCKVYFDLSGPKIRTGKLITSDKKKRLFPGDRFVLSGHKPKSQKGIPSISCTLPEAISALKEGAPVWIDDGKLGAIVEAILPDGVLLRVTHTRPQGEKLKTDKGINFPETVLPLSSLTDKDLQDLDFVAKQADIVGYSFVQTAEDMRRLQQELRLRSPEKARTLAIVAKIETQEAVHNLPELIVQGASKQPFGVMIARGDLAVELGFQRLAEIQEEILWLCEAAQVPVIWATQVLESLAKTGIPSRAEITDAAMAERAECVMLNKGPFILEAVQILDDVLMRMQAHQSKKTPQLRALRSW
jgi:pyruvate kinase